MSSSMRTKPCVPHQKFMTDDRTMWRSFLTPIKVSFGNLSDGGDMTRSGTKPSFSKAPFRTFSSFSLYSKYMVHSFYLLGYIFFCRNDFI